MTSYNLSAAEYNKLGSPASHGCVRLCVRDAKLRQNDEENRTLSAQNEKKRGKFLRESEICPTFASLSRKNPQMVLIVQLVRASDCGSECRGFESH